MNIFKNHKKHSTDKVQAAERYEKHKKKQIMGHAKIVHPNGDTFHELVLEDDTKVTFENGAEKNFSMRSRGKPTKAQRKAK